MTGAVYTPDPPADPEDPATFTSILHAWDYRDRQRARARLSVVRDPPPLHDAPDPLAADPLAYDGHGTTAFVTAALASATREVCQAPTGQRNHTLNRAAYSLGGLVAGGYLTEREVWEALNPAAATAGLTQGETDQTIRSGMAAGMSAPRFVEPAQSRGGGYGLAPAAPVVPSEPVMGVRERLPVVDWVALWAEEDTQGWVLEPLIPTGRLVALYSAPKVGKSLLMLEIAAGLASGAERVLGAPVTGVHRVLYVDFENQPRGDVRPRLEAMGYEPAQLARLFYLSFPVMGKLDQETGANDLMAAVVEYGVDVVVIDTVSRAVAGPENENDTWLSFYRHTGLRLKAANVACIRLDHSGKDVDRGMRGGSAKYGDVDAVWRLKASTGGLFRLECEANRLPIAETELVLERLENPLRHRVEPAGWREESDRGVAAAIAALDLAGVADTAGRPTCEAALVEAGLMGTGQGNRGGQVSRSHVTRAIEQRRARADRNGLSAPSEED